MQSPTSSPITGAGADPLEATRRWLEAAVIGLNLCPFAKAVHGKGQIRWVLALEAEPAALLERLAEEAVRLARSAPDAIDTTLIVAPNAPAAFAPFHRLVGLGEALLDPLGLAGVLQLAAFHPRWRFAGSRAADIANATNRAPHPTLHLLREASVSRATAAVPDAEAIWGRNVATLEALGPDGWKRLAREWTEVSPFRAGSAAPAPPPAPTSSARSHRPASARPKAAPTKARASGRRNPGR
jgi:hypothetical protein